VFFLREEDKKSTDPRTRVDRIGGILVCSDIGPGMGEYIQTLHDRGIYVRTWDKLLATTEGLHRDFLNVAKGRAPADDPRIKALDAVDTQAEDAKESGEGGTRGAEDGPKNV
jgi:hypothetical protein